MLTVLLVLLMILAVPALLFVLAVRGRRHAPGLEKLRGWSYAHRGLHDDTRPENSLAAFRAAVDAGYGMELDVHLLRDGSLAVLHDSNMKRMTGADEVIENLTAEELPNYRLAGTAETIPLFRDVLALVDGAAPLIVELKAHGDNADALSAAACAMLADYTGLYCIESFDPRCVRWLRWNRPDLIRGQLTEDFIRSDDTLSLPLRFAMKHQLFNFLTLPDFVAYNFVDRKTISNRIVRGLWGVQGVSWTLRTPEQYDAAVREGWIPIFENFRP